MTPLRYVIEIAEALDRLVNALTGGDGRLTLSSRCWRSECKGSGWPRHLRKPIDAAAYVLAHQRDHCRSSDAFDTALVAVAAFTPGVRDVAPSTTAPANATLTADLGGRRMTSRTPAEQALLDAANAAEKTLSSLIRDVEAERTGTRLSAMYDLHSTAADLMNDLRADLGDTSGARTQGGGGDKTGGGDPPPQ